MNFNYKRSRNWAVLIASVLIAYFFSFIVLTENEEGTASYYADSFHGNPTANGELYDKNAMTAAHLTLPFGTKVKVTNLENNKSVVVRINDRGPHINNRIIDVSWAAAKKLGLLNSGTATVRIEK